MFPETFETERLHFSPRWPGEVDVHELYEICSSDPGIEEITEYVTWSPHETLNETQEFLERGKSRWEDGEAAGYVIRPKASEDGVGEDGAGENGAGEIAGCTGIGIDWDRSTATLGLWLRKRFWGRGYSGERAAALCELAFDQLDLDIVAVSHHPDNEQSERAIEKYVDRFGGRREGLLRNELEYQDGSVHDEVRYTISQVEWREATGGGTDIL